MVKAIRFELSLSSVVLQSETEARTRGRVAAVARRQLGGALSASGRTLPEIEARTPSDQRERPGQKVASHRARARVPAQTSERSSAVIAGVCSEALLWAAHRQLLRHSRPLLAAWRDGFQPRRLLLAGDRRCSARTAAGVLEQLLIPRPSRGSNGGGRTVQDFDTAAALGEVREQIRYAAARLAKLSVPLPIVNAALAQFQPLATAQLATVWDEGTAAAVQNCWQQQTSAAVAEAYVASSGSAVQALLAVLDAELSAGDLPELLQRLLRQAAQLFPIRWGEILLVGSDGKLHHAAAYGFDPSAIREEAGAGAFFEQIVRRARPDFLRDASREPRLGQPYFRTFQVKSLWAVPLTRGERSPHASSGPEVLGVMAVAFARRYECLPQERELLLALAERSTLAIERTRITERLGEQQKRVLELSRRLLDAQDEERRRISRDLHDETGQALLALRLYLEMGMRADSRRGAQKWLRQGLDLVDNSVAELRRILAQLSPLLLDELGLESALRLELRRLRQQQQWRTRFQFTPGPVRLDRGVEILVYRVVLEGLRNIARHAQARHVQLKIVTEREQLRIWLRDDGIGMTPPETRPARKPSLTGTAGAVAKPALSRRASAATVTVPTHFGLAGMRERVRLAGGQLKVESARSRGVALSICIPLTPPTALAAAAVHAS